MVEGVWALASWRVVCNGRLEASMRSHAWSELASAGRARRTYICLYLYIRRVWGRSIALVTLYVCIHTSLYMHTYIRRGYLSFLT